MQIDHRYFRSCGTLTRVASNYFCSVFGVPLHAPAELPAILHFRQKLYSLRGTSEAGAVVGRGVALRQSGGKDSDHLSESFWSCAYADDVVDQRSEFRFFSEFSG